MMMMIGGRILANFRLSQTKVQFGFAELRDQTAKCRLGTSGGAGIRIFGYPTQTRLFFGLPKPDLMKQNIKFGVKSAHYQQNT